jgi:hypothetical protein
MPVSVKDRSSGPDEQVRLCTDACRIYVYVNNVTTW